MGITPLDFDHISLLGHSIESIAWNKGGIMKEDSIAFTVEQPEAALKVLKERSLEKKVQICCGINIHVNIYFFQCDLKIVENSYYHFENKSNFPSHIQRINASLALAISEAYVKKRSLFSMEVAKKAIEESYWPGRYEIKQLNKIR